MKVFAKQVNSYSEWKEALCASYSKTGKTDKWRKGRSAESLAYDFVGPNPTGEKSIMAMVSSFLGTDEICLDYSHIEHSSFFDNYSNPRKQDLAIWGTAAGLRLFIGIEAKVDEPFGSNSVSEQEKYVQSLIDSNISTEADKRLNELKRDFLSSVEKKEYPKIRYQLLFYLAGSIREPDTDVVFMPVIVYKSRGKKYKAYTDSKGDANFTAYENFMKLLGFNRREDLEDNERVRAYENLNSWGKKVYSCYIVK